jgi:hypothetical protein
LFSVRTASNTRVEKGTVSALIQLESGAATPSNPTGTRTDDSNNNSPDSYKKVAPSKHNSDKQQICICSTCFVIRDHFAEYYRNKSLIFDNDATIFSFFGKDLVK